MSATIKHLIVNSPDEQRSIIGLPAVWKGAKVDR